MLVGSDWMMQHIQDDSKVLQYKRMHELTTDSSSNIRNQCLDSISTIRHSPSNIGTSDYWKPTLEHQGETWQSFTLVESNMAIDCWNNYRTQWAIRRPKPHEQLLVQVPSGNLT